MKRLFALLLAVVMVLSMAACGKKDPETATPDTPTATPDQATELVDTTEPTTFIPEIGEGIFSRTSYTAADQELVDQGDVVVATMEDRTLTVGELQVYYWMNVYNFLNQYGYYLSYFGLDLALPLDQQQCPETGGTWQQYFLDMALASWKDYQSLTLAGEAANTPMNADMKEELDNLKTNLEKSLAESEHESLDAMLQADLAPGITFEAYNGYLQVYYMGYSYYSTTADAIEVTDAMIEDYFNRHQEDLAKEEITKEKGKVVDVRHILVSVEGGTTDEAGNTTHTDEEWATCEKDAQAILDQWLAGDATEESFGQLAAICPDDPGSKETGGLYEGVKTGDMVKEFDAWCFDESRKVGDYGLVTTDYGCHVMYYCGDEALWISRSRDGAKEEKIAEFVTAAAEAYPATIDYDKLMVGHVNLAAE